MTPLLPLLVAATCAAEVAPPPRPVPDPFAAVAWVRAEGEAAGTGVVVDVGRRWLVTCRHVVGERKAVEVFFPWRKENRELVTERAEYLAHRDALRKAGLLVRGTVVRTSDAADLALVELDAVPAGVTAAPPARRVGWPGEVVRVVGNRNDLDTLWNVTTGPVRAAGPLPDGYFWRGVKLAAGVNAVVAQLPIEEGDSGGPVFDAKGELLGVAAALRRGCPLAAVVVSAVEVKAFVDGEGVKPAPRKAAPPTVYDTLIRATVWVRPSATDHQCAAVLIDTMWGRCYLTSARGIGPGDRVALVSSVPTEDGTSWTTERAAYRNPGWAASCLGWDSATVVARDPVRDLALLQLDDNQGGREPAIPLAAKAAVPGDAVHAMSHPAGLELAWVYAAGAVRQRGRVNLAGSDPADAVDSLILQLPAQGRAPGGPVVNDAGELVGLLTARDGPAGLVGYAVSLAEIRSFLDVARPHAQGGTPAQTWSGVLSRAVARVNEERRSAAGKYEEHAHGHFNSGRYRMAIASAERAMRVSPPGLRGDLGVEAALVLAKSLNAQGKPADAARVLDRLVEVGRRDDYLLKAQAALATAAKDHRKARSSLELLVEINPYFDEPRLALADTLFELGEDEKAAAAYADGYHLGDSPAVIAIHARRQADAILAREPKAHGRAADWMAKVFAALSAKAPRDPRVRDGLEPILRAAAAAKTDADRLAALRRFAPGTLPKDE